MATASQSSILNKCGLILDILAKSSSPLSLSDVVEKSGLVKSSTHRILTIMAGEEFVSYDPTSRSYRLGSRPAGWARAAMRRADLQKIAEPELEKLLKQTNLNVALSVRHKESVVFLRILGQMPERYMPHAGDQAPLHCTAVGKVFLAFMDERHLTEILPRLKFERLTEHTISDPDTLLADLQNVRKRGYGLAVNEEFFQELGVAAPIWNANGEVVAGISLWSRFREASRKDIVRLAPQVLSTARKISRELGFDGDL